MPDHNFWPQLGFHRSPYRTVALSSDEAGAQLLVGRERELTRLQSAITSADAHASLDGPSGVGKTSLIAVALQALKRQQVDVPALPPYYPVKYALNVMPGMTGTDVLQEAIFAVAQTLLTVAKDLGESLASGALSELSKWLNSPTFTSRAGGATAFGFGGNAARSSNPNTSVGFERSGVATLVLEALEAYFPTPNSGAVVAVLENVELAGALSSVRQLLESIRDPLFTASGLRWIVSGAGGAVSVASGSARLDGIIGPPIHVRPLRLEDAGEVVNRRVEHYKSRAEPDTPVDADGFQYLFAIARGNLRTAFRYSDEFSSWAYGADAIGGAANERRKILRGWLRTHAEERLADLEPIDGAMWKAFDRVHGWPEGVAEFAAAHAEDRRAFGELERRGLLERDEASKTVRLSTFGWLIAELPATRRV